MKTAIYIADGVMQLVLTGESEFEKNTLAAIEDKRMTLKIFRGQFYRCQGGWVRHDDHPNDDDRSLILTVDRNVAV